MATAPALTSVPVRGPTGLETVLHRLGARWRRALARRREIVRITRELQVCTDRELAELGLGRGDIPDVARGTFRAG